MARSRNARTSSSVSPYLRWSDRRAAMRSRTVWSCSGSASSESGRPERPEQLGHLRRQSDGAGRQLGRSGVERGRLLQGARRCGRPRAAAAPSSRPAPVGGCGELEEAFDVAQSRLARQAAPASPRLRIHLLDLVHLVGQQIELALPVARCGAECSTSDRERLPPVEHLSVGDRGLHVGVPRTGPGTPSGCCWRADAGPDADRGPRPGAHQGRPGRRPWRAAADPDVPLPSAGPVLAKTSSSSSDHSPASTAPASASASAGASNRACTRAARAPSRRAIAEARAPSASESPTGPWSCPCRSRRSGVQARWREIEIVDDPRPAMWSSWSTRAATLRTDIEPSGSRALVLVAGEAELLAHQRQEAGASPRRTMRAGRLERRT